MLINKKKLDKGGGGNEWKIIQHITEPNLKNANALALNSVQKGANALFLNAKNIHTKEDICNLLDGIDLNTITIRFENHVSYPKLASLFLAYIEEKKIDKEAIINCQMVILLIKWFFRVRIA